jgi:RNA polymerase sigma factor for flagellar operon FliA
MVALEKSPSARVRDVVGAVGSKISRRLPAHVDRADLHSAAMLAIARSGLEEVGSDRLGLVAGKARTAVLDELRRQDPLPRSVRSRIRSVRATVRGLEQSLGREPSIDELVAETGLDGAEVTRLLTLADSPSEPLSVELPDPEPAPADAAETSDRFESVHRALALIRTREASVLREMFFAEADAESLAEAMGVSVQRVRQIRDAGLRHMAEALT